MKYYILNQAGNPVHEPDETKWEIWYDSADRNVGRSVIGDSQISTLFLAVGAGDESTALWETAVLGGKLDGIKDKCAGSRSQAEAMHRNMVHRVKEAQSHEK